MTLLQGNADVITFHANGRVLRRHSMQDAPVTQIAKAVLHTIIITALEPYSWSETRPISAGRTSGLVKKLSSS